MRFFTLALLPALFSACGGGVETYRFDPGGTEAPPALSRLWSELDRNNFVRTEDGQTARHTLRLVKESWTAPRPLSATALLLREDLFFPLLPLPHYRENITLEEIRSGKYRLAETAPGSPLPDGFASAAVDGAYLGEAAYPLWEKTWLILESSPGSTRARELATLIEGYRIDPAATGGPLWVAGVGDVMLERGPEEFFRTRKDGLEYVFGDALPLLRQAELLCGNLEGAVTLAGKKLKKSYNFKFLPSTLEELTRAGFDYFTLANNHTFDYGVAGFLDTLGAFERLGVKTSGAGRTLAEASAPARFRRSGRTVDVYSFAYYPLETGLQKGRFEDGDPHSGPGMVWLSEESIRAMKKRLDAAAVNIAVVHGGYEYAQRPYPEIKRLYRALIEAGIDCVFAHHPHVLQGLETWGGGVIFYSLGNFLFAGQWDNPRCDEGLIAETGYVNGRLLYLKLTGVNQRDGRMSVDSSGRIVRRVLGQRL